ncbi:MAG: single-stranded-DNA-specific exonuclease RecJ, partial [Alphaproteobacteria bacterium]
MALTDRNPVDDRPFLGVEQSVTGRAWRHRLDPGQEAMATAIGQRLGQPELIWRVLAGRGVTVDTAERHLSPSLRDDMPDPSVLSDLDTAVERLVKAVAAGEHVAIFGDYDVDGATSAALFQIVLGDLGCPVQVHIPDRIVEGYGPNGPAIGRLIDEGAQLILTVDCGTASHDALAVAQKRGVDVIVVDHHQTGVDLLPAVALVNPNRQDDMSGLGYLAAVGVSFLVLAGLVRALRAGGHDAEALPDLLELLDLVALGTVCDVVPLIGLNRAIVTKGLVAMRHRPRPGIRALGVVSRLKGPLDAGQL